MSHIRFLNQQWTILNAKWAMSDLAAPPALRAMWLSLSHIRQSYLSNIRYLMLYELCYVKAMQDFLINNEQYLNLDELSYLIAMKSYEIHFI